MMRLSDMRPRRQFLRVAVIAALMSACQGGPSVEGELSNGATKGAFQKVSLVRNPGDSLTSAIDRLCGADHADLKSRTERVQFLQGERERFKHMIRPALSQQAQVALIDSVNKYRTAASEAQDALSNRADTIPQTISTLIEAATDTQIDADRDGQFRFAKRKPGKYWLYAEWATDRGSNQFVAPVELSSGKAKQSLDRSTISQRLHCR